MGISSGQGICTHVSNFQVEYIFILEMTDYSSTNSMTYTSWVELFCSFPVLRSTSKRTDVNRAKKEAHEAISKYIEDEMKLEIEPEKIRKVLNNMKAR